MSAHSLKIHTADDILLWLGMDLRPNRRLTFHEFFTDDDEEAQIAQKFLSKMMLMMLLSMIKMTS